ncbi:hypothetical protein CRG98_025567 [Punica granatum]|uniref:RNase H type-1 domain-containing protein n=1 Tax=Punica granatum TaxID=22663 RepID=A0A2I0JDJ4_PUNGR|nr:hypothetical protein CRG98_025567 [Punica granatum]
MMGRYTDKAKALLSRFPNVVVEQVSREENLIADSLNKVAMEGLKALGVVEAKGVHFVELLKKDESHSKEIVMNVEEEKCWMTPIREYLDKDVLPSNPQEAKCLKKKAIHYTLLNGVLYKLGYSKPMLCYQSPTDVNYIIHKLHERIVRAHERAKPLPIKRSGKNTTGIP